MNWQQDVDRAALKIAEAKRVARRYWLTAVGIAGAAALCACSGAAVMLLTIA